MKLSFTAFIMSLVICLSASQPVHSMDLNWHSTLIEPAKYTLTTYALPFVTQNWLALCSGVGFVTCFLWQRSKINELNETVNLYTDRVEGFSGQLGSQALTFKTHTESLERDILSNYTRNCFINQFNTTRSTEYPTMFKFPHPSTTAILSETEATQISKSVWEQEKNYHNKILASIHEKYSLRSELAANQRELEGKIKKQTKDLETITQRLDGFEKKQTEAINAVLQTELAKYTLQEKFNALKLQVDTTKPVTFSIHFNNGTSRTIDGATLSRFTEEWIKSLDNAKNLATSRLKDIETIHNQAEEYEFNVDEMSGNATQVQAKKTTLVQFMNQYAKLPQQINELTQTVKALQQAISSKETEQLLKVTTTNKNHIGNPNNRNKSQNRG